MLGRLRQRIKKVVIIEAKSADKQVYRLFKMPRVGPMLLVTILKELGYEARVYCEDLAPIDWSYVLSADIVGISTVTASANRGYDIADEIRSKAPHIPIIMGGVHVTFAVEEALRRGADIVVRNEGEKTLPELLEALEGKREYENVLGISFLRDGQLIQTAKRPFLTNEELDALPTPDETLVVGHEHIRIVLTVTSRGCPHKCSFCSVIKMFGSRYRTRSVQNVLDELELRATLAEGRNLNIFIGDDNFTANSNRAIRIGEGIIERELNLSLSAQMRTDTPDKVLVVLKRAGMGYAYSGLESVNEEALKESNKRQDVEQIVSFIDRCRKIGIKIHGMFVMGFSSDTAQTVRETLKFAIKHRLATIQFLILTPFPGTDIYKYLDEKGLIFDSNWDHYNAHTLVFVPENIKPSVLQKEVYHATKGFYSLRGIVKALLQHNRAAIFLSLVGWYEARRWGWGDEFGRHMSHLRNIELQGRKILPRTNA